MVVNDDGIKGMFNDKMRWGLTLAIGMLVTLWRVVLPTSVEITVGIVILVAVLDLMVTAAVIFLNKKELKEAILRKVTWKDLCKLLLFLVIAFPIMTVVPYITTDGGWSLIGDGSQPAQVVSSEFHKIFPLGISISTIILAPIWEEIVFRFTAKNLIKSRILFLVVSPLLFAFIHTANFSIMDNALYLFFGFFFAVSYLIVKDIRMTMIIHCMQNLGFGVVILRLLL